MFVTRRSEIPLEPLGLMSYHPLGLVPEVFATGAADRVPIALNVSAMLCIALQCSQIHTVEAVPHLFQGMVMVLRWIELGATR